MCNKQYNGYIFIYVDMCMGKKVILNIATSNERLDICSDFEH